jgi:hypothetical protein
MRMGSTIVAMRVNVITKRPILIRSPSLGYFLFYTAISSFKIHTWSAIPASIAGVTRKLE